MLRLLRISKHTAPAILECKNLKILEIQNVIQRLGSVKILQIHKSNSWFESFKFWDFTGDPKAAESERIAC